MQGRQLSPLLTQIVLKAVTSILRQERERKDIQIRREEIRLSLFVYKIPKTYKNFGTNKYILQGCRTQNKSIVYITSMSTWTIKKTQQICSHSKNIKYKV